MRTTLLTPGENEHREGHGRVEMHGYELNAEALAGLALVRRFELADMCDRDMVIRLVAAVGCHQGATWLHANPHLYFLAVRKVNATLAECRRRRETAREAA